VRTGLSVEWNQPQCVVSTPATRWWWGRDADGEGDIGGC
jgi:hypothetical protein